MITVQTIKTTPLDHNIPLTACLGRAWAGHEDIKWGASSSCAPQSLHNGSPQTCPLLRELNLDASNSRPWQPSRRRILKLNLVVRWSRSAQAITDHTDTQWYYRDGGRHRKLTTNKLSATTTLSVMQLRFVWKTRWGVCSWRSKNWEVKYFGWGCI